MSNRNKANDTYHVNVVVEEDGSGYYAYCPDLGAIHVYGDTIDEVKENVRDALLAYVEMSIKHGDPLPASKSEKTYTANLVNWFAGIVGKRRQSYSTDIRLA